MCVYTYINILYRFVYHIYIYNHIIDTHIHLQSYYIVLHRCISSTLSALLASEKPAASADFAGFAFGSAPTWSSSHRQP